MLRASRPGKIDLPPNPPALPRQCRPRKMKIAARFKSTHGKAVLHAGDRRVRANVQDNPQRRLAGGSIGRSS